MNIKKHIKSRRGFVLPGFMMFGTLLSIGTAIFFLQFAKASRNIQSQVDAKDGFEDKLQTLQLILSDKETCRGSNLINLPINPSAIPEEGIGVAITLPGEGKPGPLFLEDKLPVELKIRQMTLLKTVGIRKTYMVKMYVSISARGQDIYFTVEMQNGKIVECYGAGTKIDSVDFRCDTYVKGNSFTKPTSSAECPSGNIAEETNAVEGACPAGTRLQTCTPKCLLSDGSMTLVTCAAHPTENNTQCWGQCLEKRPDGKIQVCGSNNSYDGGAQISMTCIAN